MDNCPSHKTQDTLYLLSVLKIPTIFTAPASYLAVPIEGLFAAIKQKDFERDES